MTEPPKIKCKKCKIEMILISYEKTMDEPDSDMTEGQMADYIGAQESGDLGNWAAETHLFQCPKCKKIVEFQYF